MAVRRISRRPAAASSYDEDPVDTPRAGARRAVPNRGAEPARGRRARPTEDDDAVGDDGVPAVGAGWSAYKRVAETMPSDFPMELRLPDDEAILIKFLQAEPFATYRQHWCDWLGKGQKLSYVCPVTDCPICDEVGDRPDFKSAFNVVDLSTDVPTVKVLVVGLKVGQLIEKKHKDSKTGPLDREDMYFSIYKSGDKKRTQTNLDGVKARDVEEDWKIAPLTTAELNKLQKQCWDKSAIPTTPRKTLQEVAEAAQ